MEPLENFCLICLEGQSLSQLIAFSCNHVFCSKCSPYLLLTSLKSPKFILENILSCPICLSGNAEIPSEKLLEGLTEIATITHCFGCDEHPAVSFCIDCNKPFCDDCLTKAHQLPKFQTHQLSNLEQSVEKPQFQCICPGKHFLSHICFSCQKAICSVCLKLEHEKHKVVSIEEFTKNPQENVHEILKIWGEGYLNLNKSIDYANTQFINLIDEMASELQNLKEKALKTTHNAISQNELAQSLLSKVEKEYSQSLHPNKHFIISKILNSIKIQEGKPLPVEWKVGESRITEILKIKQMVQHLNNLPLEITEKDNNIQNDEPNDFDFDFKSNPIELFQNTNNERI